MAEALKQLSLARRVHGSPWPAAATEATWRRHLVSLAAAAVAASLLVLSVGLAANVAAATREYIPVSISLSAPASVGAGAAIPVSVHVSAGGYPVVHHLIRFYIAGVEVGAITTNYSGDGAKSLRNTSPPGTQTLTAVFRGGGRLEPASASRTISIVAAQLSIRLVPYVPNAVTVSINGGVPFGADAAGYITADVTSGKRITLTVVTHDPTPNVRVSFVQWSNGDTSPIRSVHVGARLYTQIALQASFLTPLKFEDGVGSSLPRSQIQGVSLVGPDGTKVAVGNQAAAWLSTPVPRRTTSGALAVGNETYTMVTANYRGVNVANQGVDRFVPSAGGAWTVRLRVFPMTLFTRNTVLGGQVNATALLTGPAGLSRRLELSDRGTTTVMVPVGRYTVKILSGGFGPALKVRVSRAERVPLPMLTPIDIGGGVAAVLVVALAILGLGPWRRRVVDWVFAGELS